MSGSGLNVSDVVKVDINLQPVAVPLRNFGSLCIVGISVIDVKERIREYTTLDGVAADFGTGGYEYACADAFFSQAPTPAILYIGRWAEGNTHAILHGGLFSTAGSVALMNAMETITDGTFQITIDGKVEIVSDTAAHLLGGAIAASAQKALFDKLRAHTAAGFTITIDGTLVPSKSVNMTPIPLTPVDMPAIATHLTTTIAPHGTVTWDATLGKFSVTSATIGANSKITFATVPAAGMQDVSVDCKLTQAAGAAVTQGKTGMDFTGQTNLNGCATVISTALPGGTCKWTGTRFDVTSDSTGPASTLSYASPTGVGRDMAGLLRLTEKTGASIPVNGINAETPLRAAQILRQHPQWYGMIFCLELNDAENVSIGTFLEGANPISIYGYSTSSSEVIDSTNNDDIASQMRDLGLRRSFGQYSSTVKHINGDGGIGSSTSAPVCSAFGRAFTTDFEGSNTMITLKFKQEPIVIPELLTENQAATLKRKNINVFVQYSNGVAIIQEGVMANGFFFDEVHGTDWLSNRVQTDVFNVLYTAPTKIPQTNQGVHILVATVENSLAQGVVNGLIAPGQWNAPGFGQINFGQMLPKGYYVWAPLVESQDQAQREARIAPTIQCAIKLAGAIHFAHVIVNVNR